jgi:hypothetical protein
MVFENRSPGLEDRRLLQKSQQKYLAKALLFQD